jgi:curli biogenesis system outer membrane secretion channel CsgG
MNRRIRKYPSSAAVAALLLLQALLPACATRAMTPPPEDSAGLTIDLPPYTGKKQVLAVLDLQNLSQFDDTRIGRGVSNMLITALVNTGRFTVVERNEAALKKIFEEQKLGVTGAVTPQTAARVGKMLGARLAVIGEVSEFGIRKTSAFVGVGGTKTITTRVVVDARMVDTETAETVSAASGIGTAGTSTSGVALTFEFGTAGFDETTIGMATRKAVNRVAETFARQAEAKQTTKEEIRK